MAHIRSVVVAAVNISQISGLRTCAQGFQGSFPLLRWWAIIAPWPPSSEVPEGILRAHKTASENCFCYLLLGLPLEDDPLSRTPPAMWAILVPCTFQECSAKRHPHLCLVSAFWVKLGDVWLAFV